MKNTTVAVIYTTYSVPCNIKYIFNELSAVGTSKFSDRVIHDIHIRYNLEFNFKV